MALENLRQEWSDLDPKFRWILIALGVAAAGFLLFRMAQPDRPKPAQSTSTPAIKDEGGNLEDPNKRRLLPSTPRNQGLEDMKLMVQGLSEQVARLSKSPPGSLVPPAATANAAAAAASSPIAPMAVNLDSALPPPVNFDAPGAGVARRRTGGKTGVGGPFGDDSTPPAAPIDRRMKVWDSDKVEESAEADLPLKIIPVNSALESVMLTGINARPSGSIGGAVGSVNSANNVGAPFVTRIKGDAILPNGWRLSDLGDCFLGGSGIAILSTERAYVIAANLSCIASSGVVYEGAVKAYGVDVDGTLGIAGKVVSKQGTLLLQSALTGMASGLGTALSPQALPSYNSNATSGSTTGVQFPNPAAVAQTAVGQGINQAAGQLSKFYLEYAKEVFPVVEVTSQTRVTWVLTESIELKPHANVKKVAQQ